MQSSSELSRSILRSFSGTRQPENGEFRAQRPAVSIARDSLRMANDSRPPMSLFSAAFRRLGFQVGFQKRAMMTRPAGRLGAPSKLLFSLFGRDQRRPISPRLVVSKTPLLS